MKTDSPGRTGCLAYALRIRSRRRGARPYRKLFYGSILVQMRYPLPVTWCRVTLGMVHAYSMVGEASPERMEVEVG